MLEPTTPQVLAGHDVVVLALPHGASRPRWRPCCRRRSSSSTAAPITGSTDPAAWAAFYGSAYAGAWPYGLPELRWPSGRPGRDGLAGRPGSPSPAATRPAASLALAPGLAAGLLDPADIVVVAAQRHVRRRQVAQAAPARQRGRWVDDAVRRRRRAPAHPGDRAEPRRRRGAPGHRLFTPTLAPMPRGILATVHRQAPARRRRDADAVRAAWVEAYADEPFVHVLPDGPWPQHGRHPRRQHRPPAGRPRRAHRPGDRAAAVDNLTKGTAGAPCSASTSPSACPRPSVCPSPESPRERHRAPRGIPRGRRHRGPQGQRQPRRRARRQRRPRPPRRRGVHDQPGAGRARRLDPPGRRRRPPRRGRAQLRRRQRVHRARRLPRHPPHRGARRGGCSAIARRRRRGLLHRPDRRAAADGPAARRRRRRGRGARRRRRRGRGARDHDHRHRAPRQPPYRRRRLDGRRHGQGRRDARARAWRPCSSCSPRTPSPTPPTLDAALRAAAARHLRPRRLRRLHVDQRHRPPARLRRVRRRARRRGISPPRSRRSAPSSPARCSPTPRAPTTTSRSRSFGAATESTTPSRWPGRSPAATCSSPRCSATTRTGAACSPPSARPRPPSTRGAWTSPSTASRSAGPAASARTAPWSTWRPRRARVVDLHAGDATATIWTNDLTHDYVHENCAYSHMTSHPQKGHTMSTVRGPIDAAALRVAAKAAMLVEALPWLERFAGAARRRQVRRQRHGRRPSSSAAFAAGRRLPPATPASSPSSCTAAARRSRAMLDRLGHRQRVPRRPAGHHARGHGRRPDGAHRPGRARARRACSTQHGPLAVGLSGEDAGLFGAAPPGRASSTARRSTSGSSATSSRSTPPRCWTSSTPAGFPVVSTVAPDLDHDGQVLNVNADTAAAALAVALGAQKLVVLTDVEGLYADWPDPGSLLSQITVADARGAAAGTRGRHGPEDGGLPPGGRGRRRRRRTSSTAGRRTACCSRSSPPRASARWCSRTRSPDEPRPRPVPGERRTRTDLAATGTPPRCCRVFGAAAARPRARRAAATSGTPTATATSTCSPGSPSTPSATPTRPWSRR